MSIIAYAEGGLTAYTAAAALVATRLAGNSANNTNHTSPPTSDVLLAGLLSGAAMACKYTGLVMTVVTQNADSFKKSSAQITRDLKKRL